MKVKCYPRHRRRESMERNTSVQWKMSAPFVVNKRAVLTHRVKSASSHPSFRDGLPHHSCVNWCNSSFNSGHLEFTEEPPDSRLLCEVCEANAVRAGELTADELAGRHVHKGRLKAFRTCCQENSN